MTSRPQVQKQSMLSLSLPLVENASFGGALCAYGGFTSLAWSDLSIDKALFTVPGSLADVRQVAVMYLHIQLRLVRVL